MQPTKMHAQLPVYVTYEYYIHNGRGNCKTMQWQIMNWSLERNMHAKKFKII